MGLGQHHVGPLYYVISALSASLQKLTSVQQNRIYSRQCLLEDPNRHTPQPSVARFTLFDLKVF